MSDTSATPLLLLVKLASVDALIFGLESEKKRTSQDGVNRRQAIEAQRTKRVARAKVLDERRALCLKEEKSVKVERERVNERRRALGTLNNYKVQQAAEREIEFVAKQIGKREEMVLALMREVELLEKEVGEIDTALVGLEGELAAVEKDSAESIAQIDARLLEYRGQRAVVLESLAGAPALTLYTRTQSRYPNDPVAKITDRESCAGCHMKVGPQIVVQVSRGDVVKCPGCGRILWRGEPPEA